MFNVIINIKQELQCTEIEWMFFFSNDIHSKRAMLNLFEILKLSQRLNTDGNDLRTGGQFMNHVGRIHDT
jgi:hypothetical protein